MADNISVKAADGSTVVVSAKDFSSVYLPRHVISDEAGHIMPSGDAAARPILTRLADGTTAQTLVDVDGAIDERTDHYVPCAAVLMGSDLAASAGAMPVPIQVVSTAVPNLRVGHYNGANATPAGDAVGRRIYVQHTDGTNSTPSMDAAARPGFQTLSDGTNAAAYARLAAQQAYLCTKTIQVIGSGEQVVNASIVTGTTTPTATLAAPGALTIFVVRHISISLACTVDQVPLLFKLIQDTGGTPLVLWQGTLSGLAKTCSSIVLTGLAIPQTVANKALDLSVTAGTIASTNYIAVEFGASICT